MAIIYTYTTKTDPVGADLLLISDSEDSNKTKKITISSLPSSSGGDTYTLQAEAKAGLLVPLKLDAATGSDSTVNLKEGENITLTRNSATEIEITASGGSGGVSTFTNTNGTFISAGTANSAATGAVTMGTIDLSATGTASNTTFLRGDNTWATPTGSGGISFSGTTANGIATYSNSTTANVSSVFTVSGNKLSAPAGSLADPSIEVGAIGGLYAASGGILLAHNGANAIGVTSSSIVNHKLTQFDAGLKFGSAGGTLNKYEEGTWTPTAYVVTGSAPTVTSSNGTYTIVGDICHITFKIVVTGSSSSNVGMVVGGIPAAATADNTAGEKSAGQLFVNSDSNTPAHYPSIFSTQGNLLTMIVQGGSKNSATSPLGLKAGDVTPSWYRPSAGTGITLEGSATYKLA